MPVLIRIVECLLQLGFVALLNRRSGHDVWGRFSIWDGQLYAQIAHHGYPTSIHIDAAGQLTSGNNLAFSPLFPALIWPLSTITRLDITAAAIAISWISGCALSVCVYLLARDAAQSRQAGYLACALIGVLPMAVVLQMGYAEALFAALSAAAMLAATRNRWWLAATLAALAGAARPIGYVVVAGLAVYGLLAIRSAAVPEEDGPAAHLNPRRPPGLLTLAALCAVGLSGTLGYWIVVAIMTGRPTGWFYVERVGWGTHFDGGRSAWQFVWSTVTQPTEHPGLPIAFVVILLIALAATVASSTIRADLPYGAIAFVTLASVLVSTNYWHSRARLLLAAALIVVPLATRLRAINTAALLPYLGVAFVVSAWFGAFMITQWPYAI